MSKDVSVRRTSFTQLAGLVHEVGAAGWQWTTK